jgi:hypothetical protein
MNNLEAASIGVDFSRPGRLAMREVTGDAAIFAHNLRIMDELSTIAHKFQAKSAMSASVTPDLNRTQSRVLRPP